MNGEDDRSIVVLGQSDKTFDDVESIECVQAARRFVEKENAGTGHELAGNTYPSFLAPRNAATFAFFGSNELIPNVIDTQLLLDFANL